jgi:hypothetical protein
MLKLYLVGFESRKGEESKIVDVWFCHETDKACKYGSLAAARTDTQLLNSLSARLTLKADGERTIDFICQNFEAAELAPDSFSIFFEALPLEAGLGKSSSV